MASGKAKGEDAVALGVVFEAMEDPDMPGHLSREVIDYILTLPLDDLEDDNPNPSPSPPVPPDLLRRIHPMVALRLGGAITQVIVDVMPPRTTLRHALAFQIIALAHYQGREITVAEIQRRGGVDRWGKAVFGSSFPKTYKTLIDHGLVTATGSHVDERANALALSRQGGDLVTYALKRAGIG